MSAKWFSSLILFLIGYWIFILTTTITRGIFNYFLLSLLTYVSIFLIFLFFPYRVLLADNVFKKFNVIKPSLTFCLIIFIWVIFLYPSSPIISYYLAGFLLIYMLLLVIDISVKERRENYIYKGYSIIKGYRSHSLNIQTDKQVFKLTWNGNIPLLENKLSEVRKGVEIEIVSTGLFHNIVDILAKSE